MKNKFVILCASLLIVLMASCSIFDTKIPMYEKVLKDFAKAGQRPSLIDHFPGKLYKKEFLFLFSAPPPCHYKHKNFFGEIYLIKKKSTNDKLDSLLTVSIARYKYFNKGNFIIDFLKMSEKTKDSFNVYRINKYPVPLFENINFDTWKLADSESNHTVPKDLVVYILDAKNKPVCNVSMKGERPESLKIWKHGYSKGIAVSDKKNLIVYWTIVW